MFNARRTLLSTAILATVAFGAGAAQATSAVWYPPAEPLSGDAVYSLVTNGTLYTSDFAGFWQRDDVLRFSHNGLVSDNYTEERGVVGQYVFQEHGLDRGSWAVEGDALCMSLDGVPGEGPRCFVLSLVEVNGYGGDRYRATNVNGAGYWEFTLEQ